MTIVDSWNDKYLDYEIETLTCVWVYGIREVLETTSTSITRLKHPTSGSAHSQDSPLETTSTSITRLKLNNIGDGDISVNFSWNDKYLDYEIETPVRWDPSKRMFADSP